MPFFEFPFVIRALKKVTDSFHCVGLLSFQERGSLNIYLIFSSNLCEPVFIKISLEQHNVAVTTL